MIRIGFSLLLFYISTIISYSQCPGIDKLVYGGNYKKQLTTHNPQTDKFLKFKEQENSTLYYYPINNINKYAKNIVKESKDYIISRAGNNFYNKLTFHDLMIVYPNYRNYENFDSLKFNLDKFQDITYCVAYKYQVDSLVEYRFCVEFNSKNIRISDHPFPKKESNKDIEPIISVCDAIKIARTNPEFGEKSISQIKLEYSDINNVFCWLISEGYDTNQLNNGEKYETLLLHINAQNGEIIEVEKQQWVIDETDF